MKLELPTKKSKPQDLETTLAQATENILAQTASRPPFVVKQGGEVVYQGGIESATKSKTDEKPIELTQKADKPKETEE